MKVVINKCYGGFGLSTKAFERLIELGMKVTVFNYYYNKGTIRNENANIVNHKGEIYGDYSFVKNNNEMRTNLLVIQIVEELKDKANGKSAELKIVDIPDDIEWTIEEYDGIEWIAEKHRTWS